MIYAYHAYSMVIHTTFPCPQLLPADMDATPNIVVHESSVPKRLNDYVVTDKRWDASPGSYLWRGGPRSGRFLVESGSYVTLERNPGAEDDLLALHFLTNVLVAVLRQRGHLVLHASAAAYETEMGKSAIAVSGVSGAGKSTSLAAILSAGGQMLTDDITALALSEDGRPIVLPGLPRLYLCSDSVLEMSYNTDKLRQRADGREKTIIPTNHHMADRSAPLVKMFMLRKYSGMKLRLRQIKGSERFTAIQDSIHGPMFPEEHPLQFELFSALVDHVDVFCLERPENLWTSKEISKVLLNA